MGKTKKGIQKFNNKITKIDKKRARQRDIKKQQNIKTRVVGKIVKKLEEDFINFMIDHINENYPRLITNNNFRKYDLKTILE